MSEYLTFYGSLISQIFNFHTPWFGLAFGSIIVGVFGAPLLVKAIKKFF